MMELLENAEEMGGLSLALGLCAFTGDADETYDPIWADALMNVPVLKDTPPLRRRAGKEYKRRLSMGWTEEESLSGKGPSKWMDHLGNGFRSRKDMARYWGVADYLVANRLKAGWSIEEALTKQVPERPKDHLGNEFETYQEMCAAWGVSYQLFSWRRRTGKSLEECLAKPKE